MEFSNKINLNLNKNSASNSSDLIKNKILPQTASSNNSNSIDKKVLENNQDEFTSRFMPVENKKQSVSLGKLKAPLKCYEIAEFVPNEDYKNKDLKNIR